MLDPGENSNAVVSWSHLQPVFTKDPSQYYAYQPLACFLGGGRGVVTMHPGFDDPE